jgi:hypothetical protein
MHGQFRVLIERFVQLRQHLQVALTGLLEQQLRCTPMSVSQASLREVAEGPRWTGMSALLYPRE